MVQEKRLDKIRKEKPPNQWEAVKFYGFLIYAGMPFSFFTAATIFGIISKASPTMP